MLSYFDTLHDYRSVIADGPTDGYQYRASALQQNYVTVQLTDYTNYQLSPPRTMRSVTTY